MKRIFQLSVLIALLGCSSNQHVEYYETGEIKTTGIEQNGKRIGVWKSFSMTGELVKRQYYDNDTLKLIETFSKNQILFKEEMNGDTREGNTYVFYENGTLQSKSLYINGIQKISWSYYQNGKIKSKFHLDEAGKPQGECTQYYRNGQINVKAIDYGNCETFYYSKNGEHLMSLLFHNYELIDTTFLAQNGVDILKKDMSQVIPVIE